MRTIIAGSRSDTDMEVVRTAMASASANGIDPTVVLSGTARGVDRLGEMWALEYEIPVERYPADWDTYGKSAGYRRNEDMAKRAEALVAIWDGESKGTGHMIDLAKKHGLIVYVSPREET